MSWDPATSPHALLAAADALDRRRLAALSAQLIAYIRSRDTPYPAHPARTILQVLRRKRHFDLLQQVADALLQTGCDDSTIRRQYAQALLEQGALEGAIAVLHELQGQTVAAGGEHAEVRGLVGRAYKQMYVATAPSARELRRRLLERAIAAYGGVYDESRQPWHGINAVALLERARRDGLPLPGLGIDDPGAAARARAEDILDAVRQLGDRADAWENGSAMEACIALGRHDEALEWLDAYLATNADAFELASTLRQLQEVWELDVETQPGARLIPVLQSALLAREGTAEVRVAAPELTPATLHNIDRDAGFERILGTERYQSLRWFRTALERCRSIARIESPLLEPWGTSFVVQGAALHPTLPPLVLLTNAHLVTADRWHWSLSPELVRVSFRAIGEAEQPYEVSRLLWSSRELDTTILELAGWPDDAIACPIAARRPPLDLDPPPQTYIIGHPRGDPQVMLSVRDNLVLDADDVRLHYRTPSEEGSSGSPVFNDMWEVIAIHRAGSLHTPRLNGREGTYAANEGIWIDRVRGALVDRLGPSAP